MTNADRDAAWDVFVAAPGGKVMRDACSLDHRAAIVRAINANTFRDGAWSSPLPDGWIAHGMVRLGTCAVLATPAHIAPSAVTPYLVALLASYGARPVSSAPPSSGGGRGDAGLISAYTPPRRAS